MTKNAIYMVNIPTSTSRVDVRDYAQYSIPTWKYWCEKNNVDLIINETKFFIIYDFIIEKSSKTQSKTHFYQIKDYPNELILELFGIFSY